MKSRDEIQSEISEKIINSGMWGIALCAPRTGKIKITLNCLDKNDSVLIAYPEVSIKKSWQDDIKKWKFKGKKIEYTTFMSFKKIRKLYDILVIDEIHLLSQAQMLAVAKYIQITGIKRVIGLTGTLNDDTKLSLYNFLKLPVIVNYPIEQAVNDGVITDYKITVVSVPLSSEKNIKVKMRKGGDFMTSEKDTFNYLTNQIQYEQNPVKLKMMRLKRMGVIKKSQSKIDATRKILTKYYNKRVLVFTGLTEVADNLGIKSYHSKKKDEKSKESFINGKLNHLAVVRQLNTGVTFKSLDTCIINFFDSNSENMAQKISRVTCKEYFNHSKIANIIIICSTEQQELLWLKKSLSFFDESKIKYINQ